MGGLLKQVAQVTPGGEHSLFQEAVSMFCCFSSCGIIGEGFLHPLRLGAVALTVEWLPADLPRKTGALCKRVLGEVGRHPLWHCSEPPIPLHLQLQSGSRGCATAASSPFYLSHHSLRASMTTEHLVREMAVWEWGHTMHEWCTLWSEVASCFMTYHLLTRTCETSYLELWHVGPKWTHPCPLLLSWCQGLIPDHSWIQPANLSWSSLSHPDLKEWCMPVPLSAVLRYPEGTLTAASLA